jgi:diacylglycerol kinase
LTRIRIAELPRWLRDVVPLLLWMGLIFWLSSRSRLVELDNQAEEKLFYKTSHLIAYAILAWLWWRALSRKRVLTWMTLLMAFVLTTLYGISDEIHQLFVPGRHGQAGDVLYDASGALLMILLIWRFQWLRVFPESVVFFSAKSEGKSSQIVSSQ